MRITRDFVTGLCCVILIRLVSTKETFFSKFMNQRSSNRRSIPSQDIFKFDREAYPQPLPTQPERYVMSPYNTIYQGIRHPNDTRVFRKRFEFEAMLQGHHIVCEGLFDCIISHLAIESTEATPVLLRGGAGYRYFTAIIKAKPGHELKGQVRAYCRNHYKPEDNKKHPVLAPKRRRFDFGPALEEDYVMGL